MTTTTLVILGYVLGTILIGIPMGKKSIAIYKQTQGISVYSKEKIGGFWAFLLFPWHVFEGKELFRCLDESPGINMILLDGWSSCMCEKKNYGAYLAFTAMFWPIRIYFNAVVIITYTGLLAAAGILMFVFYFLPKFVGTFLCTTKETN